VYNIPALAGREVPMLGGATEWTRAALALLAEVHLFLIVCFLMAN